MMDAKTPIFVDTNALIRLHVATAADHQIVEEALKQLVLNGAELWISRQVLREYASVLTRPQPYAPPANPVDVARQLRQFEATYRVADETAPVFAALCTLLETVPMGGKQVHDANIVASMQVYNIAKLFTLNSVDFVRFGSFIEIVTPLDMLNPGSGT